MPKMKRQFPTICKTTTKEGKNEYQKLLMRDRRAKLSLSLSKLCSCGVKRGHSKSCPL